MEKFWTEYSDKGNIRRCYVFDSITNKEDAYFLGYMACDGSFVFNRGYSFMSVNSKNKHIVEKFGSEYSPDSKILFLGKKSSEKVTAVSDVYEVRFSPKMKQVFAKFGVFDYKLNRRVVGIPNKFFGAYLRGVIDSDGFITVGYRADCRTPRLRWFITHQSEMYLADLQNKINDVYNVSTTLRQHGKNVWRLQAQNTVQNIKFLKEIFSLGIDVCDFQKRSIVENYLLKYVPQASDELLEPKGISSQAEDKSSEGSETTGEVNLLNNRNKRPTRESVMI